MLGAIQKMKTIRKRAEGVTMKDTSTILYTTQGEGGTYLWDWQSNSHDKLPFDVEGVGGIRYSHQLDAYFGLEIPDKSLPPPREVSSVAGYSEAGDIIYRYFLNLEPGEVVNRLDVEGTTLRLSISSGMLQTVAMETGQVASAVGRGATALLDSDGNDQFAPAPAVEDMLNSLDDVL
ncbi:unnamed protein product, partial [Heterosigma akashiwo]